MSEKPPSKDEALEALDFIVNVLKEHEKDLDRLVSELGSVAGQLGETGELNGKVKKIEDKINNIQNEVGNLVRNLSAEPNRNGAGTIAVMENPKPNSQTAPAQNLAPQTVNEQTNLNLTNLTNITNSIPLTLQCTQWEDFQQLTNQAQTITYNLTNNEKTVEITAIKNNQIINYNGPTPNQNNLIKTWLSKQLNTPEKNILQGNITPR